MVGPDLLATVDALSDDERVQFVHDIERAVEQSVPNAAQQALIEHRAAAMKSDPALGLTTGEALAKIRALRA